MIYQKIKENIKKMREIQKYLLDFIEGNNDDEVNILYLSSFFSDQENSENHNDFKMFIHLLMQIANEHHREHQFYEKLKQILFLLQERIKQTFSNLERFLIFKKNKILLLYLLELKIITIDKKIVDFMLKSNKSIEYMKYFYPEIRQHSLERYEKYKEKLHIKINENEDEHIKIRKIGENESFLCSLIRSDSVEQFISYVNFNKLSL